MIDRAEVIAWLNKEQPTFSVKVVNGNFIWTIRKDDNSYAFYLNNPIAQNFLLQTIAPAMKEL